MDVSKILQDRELKEELLDRLGRRLVPRRFMTASEASSLRTMIDVGEVAEIPSGSINEAIILLYGRPVLNVRNNTFDRPESDVWAARLEKYRSLIEAAIPAVGRIEVKNHPHYEWIGTGWMVAPDVVVTNRHVAVEFSMHSGNGTYSFRKNPLGRTISARVDFREEYLQPEEQEHEIASVLHIESDEGPDIALLKVSAPNSGLAQPITLAKQQTLKSDRDVVVIGYPAWDGRRNDPIVMRDIFGDIYDVKRLQPGRITQVLDGFITHDCSTLGGNSGSVVLDLESGQALALHFGGRYRDANYAVSAPVLQSRLESVGAAARTL